MAQYTNAAVQTVAVNQNVQFNETPVCSNKPCIKHREGSGLITLKGITAGNQCRALFKVTYDANIAVPAGGTVGEISTALSLDGEPLQSTIARVTPAAVDNYFSVSRTAVIDISKGCCSTIAVRNTSDQAINVQNASIVVERIG